ncbi:MAG: hypothetical protein HOC23_10720 [Halieaceae bacterium]|nr:hypothetical protein [Halieaceae bacterium]
MLTDNSYLLGICVYVAAACAALAYLTWWLGQYWTQARVALIVLLCAALLLTPAHPNAEVTTFAPALLVVLFEGMINGVEAARHALKPLAFMLFLAAVLAGLLRLIVFRKPKA